MARRKLLSFAVDALFEQSLTKVVQRKLVRKKETEEEALRLLTRDWRMLSEDDELLERMLLEQIVEELVMSTISTYCTWTPFPRIF